MDGLDFAPLSNTSGDLMACVDSINGRMCYWLHRDERDGKWYARYDRSILSVGSLSQVVELREEHARMMAGSSGEECDE